MNKLKINQFHSGSAFADAVTNSLFYTKKILVELGFESDIYCEHVATELENEILHFSKYKTDEKNVLLLHHSMGHDLDKWILSLKDKIILVYHNITPEYFFPKESPFYHYSLKGREQLNMFQKISIGSIGDSKFNTDELLKNNFDENKTKVIPLLIDFDTVKNHEWNYTLFDENSKTFNILFVGRIAPNKGQYELIKLYKIFQEMYSLPSKLYLVGGTSDNDYEQKLQDLILKFNLEEKVILTGKVSYEDLYAYYHLADAFVCLSEHEGFGVPLIEAMIFDVPVIAYDSSNIKNTLDGSGILFKEKNLEYMAGLLSLLAQNRALRREIIKTQRKNLLKYQYDNIKYELASFLNSLEVTNIDLTTLNRVETLKNIAFQIEGPFDSTYSLALLNREMGKALDKLTQENVSLFSTEGLADFQPDLMFLEENQVYNQMWKKSKKASTADVVLRNLYPPRVHDAKGLINLTNSYGWEESSFPQKYINDFNQYLDALPVTSKYVQKLMIDNGLLIPAPVVGDGADHILNIQTKSIKLKTKKDFKFLHISSCFSRKGVDVLLDAYCKTFSIQDNVCLIIKTFPNPHNDVEELIAYQKKNKKNCPAIELINKDLDDGYIVDLYKKSNCLVAPSRGEGYGLPMAEAMLFDLPVITTGFGGQIDFCKNDTSWLIDYSFEKALTHMNLFNSYWAEPKIESLSSLLKEVFTLSSSDIVKKTKKAKENILSYHKWENCAHRMIETVETIEKQPIFNDKKVKLGWVTTWNTKCGIATYSKFLIDNLNKNEFDTTVFSNIVEQEDIINNNNEESIKRVWTNASEKDLHRLYLSIKESNIETIVIQFNFGFFNLYALEKLIIQLKKLNIKIFITFHSVEDVNKEDFKASLGWIQKTLKSIERLFVHNINDLNILKSFDLIHNASLFPHGILKRVSNIDESHKIKGSLNLLDKRIISSYGFLLPHKGISELIEAFIILKNKHSNIHLLLLNALYPDPISDEYLKICIDIIKTSGLENDITMINDFLSDDESFSYLDSSDIIVMPYKQTQESSSAAVRYAISTNKPVLCTPINIFRDVDDIVHFSKDNSIEEMSVSLDLLLNDNSLLNSKNEIQKRWIEEHDWVKLSNRLSNILKHDY